MPLYPIYIVQKRDLSLEENTYRLIKPYEGLKPATPQYAAGRRVDPPVSVARALPILSKS